MNYNIRRPEEDGVPEGRNERNERWAEKTLKDVLFAAYQEQRRARTWRNIWRTVYLLVFIGVISLSFSGGREKGAEHVRGLAAHSDHTALISLTGVIGGNDYEDQVQMLRDGMAEAYKNKHVKAIVIRANSPGGSPVVSNTAFLEVRRLKKEHPQIPVYVVAEDMCASGCYYIAAAADKIYADQSSLVGSIGVIGSSFDFTGLIEKLGIKRRVRTAGSNKGMGDPFVPETPEQQAIWQQMLDQIHAEFINAVKTGRGNRLKSAENPDVFSGRVWTGLEAKKVGLIDDFGNIYSVARDVVKAPELVDYTPKDDSLSRLLNRHFGAQVKEGISQITEQRGW